MADSRTLFYADASTNASLLFTQPAQPRPSDLSAVSLTPIFLTSQQQVVQNVIETHLNPIQSLVDVDNALKTILKTNLAVFAASDSTTMLRLVKINNLIKYLFDLMLWLNNNHRAEFSFSKTIQVTRVVATITGGSAQRVTDLEWHKLTNENFSVIQSKISTAHALLNTCKSEKIKEASLMIADLLKMLNDACDYVQSDLKTWMADLLFSKTTFSMNKKEMLEHLSEAIKKIVDSYQAINPAPHPTHKIKK